MSMLTIETAPYRVTIVESCGLSHDPQVIEIDIPADSPDFFELVDADTQKRFPVQRSMRQTLRGFVRLEIAAWQTLRLSIGENPPIMPVARVDVERNAHRAVLSNQYFALEVPLGTGTFSSDDLTPSGPVCKMRIGIGPWRGRTFLETRTACIKWQGDILECGPNRVQYEYRVWLATGGTYHAAILVDAEQHFASVTEQFKTDAGDQIVWDFAEADLPSRMFLLNAYAGYDTLHPQYHMDQRIARLACWTQNTQLLDLSDGYAFGFKDSSDVIGFITLQGGDWRGNRLNHLEAWTRRWVGQDPQSRRLIPAEAKADSMDSPERIPARGRPRCTPHMNVEGWIGQGSRSFAIVLTSEKHIRPEVQCTSDRLEHFEDVPTRQRYKQQQSLLRRIHIRHGVLPLADLLQTTFSWPVEKRLIDSHLQKNSPLLNDVLRHHTNSNDKSLAETIHKMSNYIQARIYGFWEGSGCAYSNPVVARRIAPAMLRFETLCQQGHITEQRLYHLRAWFVFLSTLFASDNYYPGAVTMMPVDSDESVEPTLEGMANQNFYTDVINVFGTAAQVFIEHPSVSFWREKFIRMWHRQLEYHMYPESGVWEESHTYYQHVLHTILPTLLRRRDDGLADEFASSNLQRLVGSAIDQMTPLDSCFENRRHMASFGDHGVDINTYRYLYESYALAFQPHNQDLSGRLACIYRDMGGELSPDLSCRPISWQNQYLQGLGIMFRGTDSAGRQSLLALRCGHSWGHHHQDDGSIQFFARGRSLIVDSAFSYPQKNGPKKLIATGHSRWSLKHADPQNFLWRFNRGWITSHQLRGPIAWATASTPIYMTAPELHQPVLMRKPIWHARTVIQITATSYLIVDRSDTDLPQVVRFHVPGTNCKWNGQLAHISYDDTCSLSIVPLIPAGVSLETSVDMPLQAGECFTTTELLFDAHSARQSAFLISADDPASPAHINIGVDEFRLQSADHDIAIQFVTPSHISIIDNMSGAQTQVPLADRDD